MEGGRAEKAGGLHNAFGALLTGRNRVLSQREQQVCERGGKGNRGQALFASDSPGSGAATGHLPGGVLREVQGEGSKLRQVHT